MTADDLDTLDAQQLRDKLRATRAEVAFKQALIDKLMHENAILKRLKFAARSEQYTAEQRSLLDETFDADLAALAAELEAVQPSTPQAGDKQQALQMDDDARVLLEGRPPLVPDEEGQRAGGV